MLCRDSLVLWKIAGIVALATVLAPPAAATDLVRDPNCSGGACNVEGFDIFGAPVGTPLEVDVTFTDMQHIELAQSPSTTIEFGIGNTGGNDDLSYRIVFDLSDMAGNPITNELLVVEDVAPAGFNHITDQSVTNLPGDTIFHDFHITVETECASPGACNTFDLRVAGGAGDPGTIVSGPIRFNRAESGVWVPEPGATTMLLIGLLTTMAVRCGRGT